MVLRSPERLDPLGTVAQVARRVQAAVPGVDLASGRIVGDRWSLDVAATVEDGAVVCLTFTVGGAAAAAPEVGGTWPEVVEAVAAALDCTVFDPQRGMPLGVEPPSLPEQANGYVLQFVSPTMTDLGDAAAVWRALAQVLGVTPEQPEVVGSGWSLRVALRPNGRARRVARVDAKVSWESVMAVREMLAAAHKLSAAANWVPFDPQRNDVLVQDVPGPTLH